MADIIRSTYIKACEAAGVETHPTVMAIITAKMETGEALEEFPLSGSQLSMFESRLGDADVAALCTAICDAQAEQPTRISKLDLSYNEMGDAGADAVGRLLREVPSLSWLSLAGNSIGVGGARTLADTLGGDGYSGSLRHFNINGNPVHNEGGMHLARMLLSNRTLQVVDFGSTQLGTEAIIALATVLKTQPFVEEINLDNPRLYSLEEETAQHLAHMLSINASIRKISLKKHRIRDAGTKVIAERLQDNTALTEIDLGCNEVGIGGGEALAALLIHGSALKTLRLASNRLSNEGADALGEALRANSTLKSLDLSKNTIGDAGLCAIAQGWSYGGMGLTTLKLWGNNFGEESSALFHGLLSANASVVTDFKPYLVDSEVHIAQVSTPRKLRT